jgi:hypothetical protein
MDHITRGQSPSTLNGKVFDNHNSPLQNLLLNIIRRLLHLHGARYNACQPRLLLGILLRSLCIGRSQTHIQTWAKNVD